MTPGPRGFFERLLVGALFVFCAAHANAQTVGKPYRLEDVKELLEGGVAKERIVSRVRAACVGFQMTPSIATELRSAGADDAVIGALFSACYRAPDSPKKIDPVIRPHRRTTDDRPPVVTPQPTTTLLPVDLDLREPSSASAFAANRVDSCSYSYSSAGETVTTVKENLGCFEGAFHLPDATPVSISFTAAIGSQSSQAELMLYMDLSSGKNFYFFEIADGGYYMLATYQSGIWTFLVPWTQSDAIVRGVNVFNNVTLELRGQDVTLFANGTRLNSAKLPSPPAPWFSFGVGAVNTPPTSATFGHLHVEALR
jgi:hypothetical protein